MKVLKFGGTSLADRQCLEVASQIAHLATAESRVVIVASAMAGTTDRLEHLMERSKALDSDLTEEVRAIERQHLEALSACPSSCREPATRRIRSVIGNLGFDLEELADDPPNVREIADRVLAVGERLSVQVLAAFLQSRGCPARVVDSAGAVVTDSTFGGARVDFDATRRRCRRLFGGRDTATPVVTGFIGADPFGRTTTLGRGGSDLTAAVLGSVLDAEGVEIWTDVDGVLTAPPRLVPGVSSIPWLSYEEAAELSFFGAKVLHPQTVRPLAERGIPIRVRNTMEPGRAGTEIAVRRGTGSRVVATSVFEDVIAFRLPKGSLVNVGEVLMSCCASADGTILVAVPSSKDPELVARFGEESRFEASIVTLVGHDVALQPWVAGRALESLARRGIVVHSITAGASRHTVALLIERREVGMTLCTIHDALMLGRRQNAAAPVRPGAKEVHHVTAA